MLSYEKVVMDFVVQMTERFGSVFKEHESLAKHLNIRIGGPARFFVEVKTEDDVRDAIRTARQHDVAYFVLGGGSNTLAADEGWNGLVMKMANRSLVLDGTRVIADAGVISALAARKAAEVGLHGFAWAISLPGTMGGAVRGNAGCFGGEMKDTVTSVRVIRGEKIVEVPACDLRFGYRHSIFKDEDHAGDVIFSVTMQLTQGNRDEEMALLEKHLALRKSSQPLGSSSAGCMFKNFEFHDAVDVERIVRDTEVPAPMLASKRIAAGWIIEQLGLKGLQVGDAQVSAVHGNFLLNKGHATAKDIAMLIGRIKTAARDVYGIELQEEVQFLAL
jgi:UDP-N-acetylmuramate dehydrogenase